MAAKQSGSGTFDHKCLDHLIICTKLCKDLVMQTEAFI
jgi:hypothetical protein